MSKGLTQANSHLNKIIQVLLFLIAAFPLIPQKIIPTVIVLWILANIPFLQISFITGRSWKSTFGLIILILPFLIYLISLLYDPEKRIIYSLLERKLSLLFFPLIFFYSTFRLKSADFQKLFNVFTLAVFAELLWVNLAVFLFSKHSVCYPGEDFIFNYRQQFEHYSGIHPTYMSMFVFFALLLNIDIMVRRQPVNEMLNIWVRYGFCLVLFVAGILLGARTPLIAAVIAIVFFLFLKKGLSKKILVVVGIGFVLSTAAILITPGFKNRITEFKELQWRPPVFNEENTANIRIGIYLCSWQLLKENWVKGVGPGQLQKALNYCYSAYPAKVYDNKNYNTHNEFLNSWLSLGIAGFIAFIMTLIFPLFYALKQKDYLYAGFLVFFFICCMTENLLSRQMGVVFYALFNSLFAFRLFNEQPLP